MNRPSVPDSPERLARYNGTVSLGLSRSKLVTALLLAALLAGTNAVAARRSGAGPDPAGLLLPDLTLATSTDLRVITLRNGEEQLRFTSAVVNVGRGPLVVAGRRAAPGQPWEVVQQIMGADGDVVREFPVRVQPVWGGDGHNHWHVPAVARYRLLRLDDGTEVGTNHKIGFCFFDNDFYLSLPRTPPYPEFPDDTGCAHGDRSARRIRMGLSVGFADVYRWRMPGQSIDITGLPAGRYRLEGKANGDDELVESDPTNNVEWVDFQLIRGRRGAKVKIIGDGRARPVQDQTDRGELVLGGRP